MLSKRETLNGFGVYMVSKTRIIIPVRKEYIGIICGKNRSNLKKIYEKFDISIYFKKSKPEKGFLNACFIIYTIEHSKIKEKKLWETLNHIQNIVRYTSINKIKPEKICSYCKTDPCRDSYMCKKRKQIETKLDIQFYISPDHIQNLRSSNIEKNAIEFRNKILSGFVPISSLYDNKPAEHWVHIYNRKVRDQTHVNFDGCLCDLYNDLMNGDTFDLCPICIDNTIEMSVKDSLKKNPRCMIYYR